MPKLSKQQLDYARQRLNDIRQVEWRKLEDSCWLPEVKSPKLLQVISDIKKGKLKPKEFYVTGNYDISRSHTIHEVFGLEINRTPRTRDVKAFAAAQAAFIGRWKKIDDEFYLGDAASVLAKILDIEAGKA